MKEIFVNEWSLPDAFNKTILSFNDTAEASRIKDWEGYPGMESCLEVGATICVGCPTQEPRITRFGIFGPHELQQYEMEVLDGILDFRIGFGWDYTYHDRMKLQLELAYELLKENSTTRRAVIDLRRWQDEYVMESIACLQHIQFQIREDALDMQVLFRSNDLMNATFMNMWGLTRLQEQMAHRLGVGVGQYVHRANNLHVYKKDWGRIEKYVKAIDNRDKGELAYNYAGFWDELMNAEKPAIQRKVEQLWRSVQEEKDRQYKMAVPLSSLTS